jgi:hypothetical protein
LVTTLPEEPLMKWGLDFIGPIKLTIRLRGKKNILVAINYVIKWVETKAFITNTAIVIAIVMTFLVRECYGSPKKQEF